MGYTFRREKIETNFLRPRYTAEDHLGRTVSMKATINLETKKLCWGIVDGEDKFIAENQQLVYCPYTGVKLPATVDEIKRLV